MVLWQLFEQPMHVYKMQKVFEATGKARVVNVRSRASLYQTLERLQRHGLVQVAETVRVEGYPDRVIYAITDAGREVAREWLRQMLRATDNDYPEFLAALSILFGLPPDEARAELELRVAAAVGGPGRGPRRAGGDPPRAAPPVPVGGGVPGRAAQRRGVVPGRRDRGPEGRPPDLERGVAATGGDPVHHR